MWVMHSQDERRLVSSKREFRKRSTETPRSLLREVSVLLSVLLLVIVERVFFCELHFLCECMSYAVELL